MNKIGDKQKSPAKTQPNETAKLNEQKARFKSVAFRCFGRIGPKREEIMGGRSPKAVLEEFTTQIYRGEFTDLKPKASISLDPMAKFGMVGGDGYDERTYQDDASSYLGNRVNFTLPRNISGERPSDDEILVGMIKKARGNISTSETVTTFWLPSESLAQTRISQLPPKMQKLVQDLDQLCVEDSVSSGIIAIGKFVRAVKSWSDRFTLATSKQIAAPIMDQLARILQENGDVQNPASEQ